MTVDAFDSDVLIYAAVGDARGVAVRRLFDTGLLLEQPAGVGSVILVPAVLTKPLRHASKHQYSELQRMLAQLDLQATTHEIARLATSLGARYRLKAPDAIHLATAVNAGADRFITNNRSAFTDEITEIDVVYPDQLE